MEIESAKPVKPHSTKPLIIRHKKELDRDSRRMHLLRRAVQAGFVALIGYHVVGSQLVGENNPGAITNPEAYCPFGGLETAYYYFSNDSKFIPHTHQSNLVLLVAVLLTALLAKSAFCGWICPFGALQDFFHKLGSLFGLQKLAGKLNLQRIKVPGWLDKGLRSIKYLVLLWLLVETARTGIMVFRDYDPYSALLNLGKEIAAGGLVLLGLTLGLALFVERPWCHYGCPLGAGINLVGRLSLLKIRRDQATCLSGCTICNRACPSRIEVKKLTTVSSEACINCMSCVASCPTGALAVRLPALPLPRSVKVEVPETIASGSRAE